jgi:pilus assembly protein Flp/PilA
MSAGDTEKLTSTQKPPQSGDSIASLWADESGQDIIEYAMIGAMLGLGVLVTARGVPQNVQLLLNTLGNELTSSY